MSMDNTDIVRMRCPTCERRLEVPTNARFIACSRCGSEYTLTKRGGTLTLTPHRDQLQEQNEQIARAEQQQAGGCANLTFSSFGFAALAFIIFGILGALFNNLTLGCLLGWGVAMLTVFLGFSLAGRYVNHEQARLDQLQAQREQVAQADAEEQSR